MKNRYLFIFLLVICIGGVTKSYASHIAGGELIYTWVSDSTYEVTFKLYRDCTGVNVPNTLSLCYKNTCNSISYTKTLTLAATINGGQANGSQVSSGCPGYPTTCSSISSNIYGFQEWWYQAKITLPSRCSEWIFSVSTSARNPDDNLNPGAAYTGFYVQATLNNVIAQGNSSAEYTVKPVPYVCDNEPYVYNNGAYDVDNDSLGYEIIQPQTSGNGNNCPLGVDIPFVSSIYNLTNNPIATNNTFVLDTVTGQLTFTPSQIGKYTLALRVTEYRNRVAISTTMRDIQVYVVPCTIPAPVVAPDTNTIQLVNGKIHDCGGYPLHFCFNATSSSTSAILVPRDNHAIVAPGSTLTYTGIYTNAIYGCFSWSPSTSDTGIKILTVTVTDSSCAPPGIIQSNTFTLPLYIYPVEHSKFDTTICLTKKITLNANGANAYAWSVLPGGSSVNSLSCTNCQHPTDSPTVNTTYTAVSTLLNGCPANDTVVISVVPPPPVPVASANTPLCVHDTLKLYETVSASGYSWTGPAGFQSSAQNPLLINFQQTDTGMYYVVNQNAYCSSAPDSVKVIVFPPTYATNPDTSICIGGTVPMVGHGLTYIWSVLPGGSSGSSLSCLACLDPLATPTVSTSYVISSNQTGCNTHDTVNVTVIDYPLSPSPTSNNPICVGDTLKLYAGTPAQHYNWTGPNGFSDTTQNPTLSNAQAINSGEYYVQVANWVCKDSADSTHMLVVAPPVTPTITGNSPLCTGATMKLHADDSLNTIYTWSGPNGFLAYTQDVTLGNITLPYAGIYTVRAAFYANPVCLSPADSYTVVIQPKIVASFQLAADSICQGYPLAISYNIQGADSIDWNFSSGVAQSLSANPIEVAFANSGLQTIILNAFNSVCSDTEEHKIYVLYTPPASFTASPATVCPGGTISVVANHTYASDVKFEWNFGSVIATNGDANGPYTLNFPASGTYIVSLVTQNTYCTSFPYYDTMTVQPYPDATITSSDISNICAEDSVHFEGADVPGYHYQWQQAVYFLNDTLRSTYAAIRNSGYVYLYVTDQYGCKASDSLYITPHPCCNIYFPNSFTPNGDGKNDLFRPITVGHHDIAYFRIYNRWGQVVYSSGDEHAGWNGTIDGKPADMGTYFYSIRYRCVTGEYYMEKGEVLLVR